jgi:hypothetical protein
MPLDTIPYICTVQSDVLALFAMTVERGHWESSQYSPPQIRVMNNEGGMVMSVFRQKEFAFGKKGGQRDRETREVPNKRD